MLDFSGRIDGTVGIGSAEPSLTTHPADRGRTTMATPYSIAHRTYSDSQLLNELRRVARILKTDTMSGPAYLRFGTISRQTYLPRFGTWRAAIIAAGLKSPTVSGGLRVPCAVCGALFAGDHGRKARKTCSSACRSELSIACRVNRKGDDATPQSARGRARRKTVITSCVQCGYNGTSRRIEVHHRDGNPYNNQPENLEVLCRACHGLRHRIRPEIPCATCGVMVRPRRDTNRFCSSRCAGVYSGRRNTAKTTCLHGHPFDEANTRRCRDGSRACRACEKARYGGSS